MPREKRLDVRRGEAVVFIHCSLSGGQGVPFSGGRKVRVCCASSRCDGVLKSRKEGMDSARVHYFCLLRPLRSEWR